MTEAILNGYYSLVKGDDSTDFAIVPPAPYLHGYTKIKRWWNQSYDKVTYTGCALISYRDAYIVVSCDVNVLLKIIANNNNELTFNNIFKNQGDGGIRRILVCPKTELHNLVNYDDYYYDYSDKQIKRVKHGSGGLDLFGSASLDLQFAANKSLVDVVSNKDLITFSRASSGTYVGSDGLIKTSAVNLLTYSEQFDQSAWVKQTSVGLTPNTITAPDGTTTGTLYSISASFQRAIDQSISGLTNGNAYAFSIYIKAIVDTNVKIRNTTFDRPILVSDGWQRISTQFTKNPSLTSLGFFDNSGDTGNRFYIWGAQLEEGSTATDYIPTGATISGAPRFDHDPVTGESLGLLIEEARTNEITNNFTTGDQAIGTTLSEVTSITNPDGTTGTIKVTANAENAIHSIEVTAGSQSVNHSCSSFVKKGNHRYVGLSVGGAPNNYYCFFDFDTKTIINDGGNGNYTFVSAGFEEYANGWFRLNIVGITTGSRLRVFLVRDDQQNGLANWTATGSEFMYVWGPQLEEGSFPTSYILTSGSTVTRSPDIATIEGNKFAKTNLLEYSERFDQSAWIAAGTITTVTPDAATAPDGTNSAYLLTALADNNLGSNLLYQPILNQSNKDLVGSIYVKSSGSANIARFFVNGDLGFDRQILDVTLTNEWQRVVLPVFNTTKANAYAHVKPGDVDGSVKSFYIWGAQLEEGSELTKYTPSVETFVSRASSATYVDDATGLIKTSPVNKLLYSNEFTNAAWTKSNLTLVSSTTTAPDGTATATTYTHPSTNAKYINQTVGSVIGKSYVNSIWIKGSANATLGLRRPGMDNTVIGSDGTEAINVTTEWQKFTAVTTSAENTGGRLLVDLRSINGASVPSGFELSLWHAQLEEGTTATDYIKTTNTISGAARNENGELLLEPARTNLVEYSQDFTNSFWRNALSSSTVSSPDGGQNAYELISPNVLFQDTVRSAPANKTNTTSIFAKYAGTGNAEGIQIRVSGIGTNAPWVNFDLANGSKENTSVASGTATQGYTWTLIDYGIEPFANGWYRIHITYTCSGTSKIQFNPNDSPATDVEGSTGSGKVLVFGAQIEVSSPDSLGALYTTSYIPTTTSAVTRAADVSTSAPGVDSWYNQSEGTVFTDVTGIDGFGYTINNGSNNTQRHGYSLSTGQPFVNTPTNALFGTAPTVVAGGGLVSYAYKANDYGAYGNGTVLAGTSPTTVPVGLVELALGFRGSYQVNSFINGHIARLAYSPTRKTDQILRRLTELLDADGDAISSYGASISVYPHDLGQLPNPITRRIDIELEYGSGAVYDLNPIS